MSLHRPSWWKRPEPTRTPGRHRLGAAAVGLTVALVPLAACATGPTGSAADPSPGAVTGAAPDSTASPAPEGAAADGAPADAVPRLVPCSATPIVEPPLADHPQDTITLEWDPTAGAFHGDPAPLPSGLVERLDGAVVAVRGSNGGFSSGFVIEDGGRRLVLTAAHVTTDMPIADVEIRDLAGASVGAVAGCYALQDNGTPMPFAYGSGSLDVTVLVPDGPIGSTALSLGEQVAPGDWVVFDNVQSPFDISYGRNLYTAVAPHSLEWPPMYGILTGVGTLGQADDRHPPAGPGQESGPEYAATPGSSGGLVADLDGRVTGMSVRFSGPETLDAFYLESSGVAIEGVRVGPESGVMPVMSFLVPPAAIRSVLDAAATTLSGG